MVGVASGREVKVWRDLITKGAGQRGTLYMTHEVSGDINRMEFSPFEDCLGIGHVSGFASILVPGMEHMVRHEKRSCDKHVML